MKEFVNRVVALEKLSVDILSLGSWAALMLLFLSYGMRQAVARPCTYYFQLRLCFDLVYHAGLMLFVGLLGCLVTDLVIKMERKKTDGAGEGS